MVAPNPFEAITQLEYVLASEEHVLIEVYDLAGSRVLQLANEVRPAGHQTEQLNAGALQPGSYLIRLIAGESSTMKMIVLVGQ